MPIVLPMPQRSVLSKCLAHAMQSAKSLPMSPAMDHRKAHAPTEESASFATRAEAIFIKDRKAHAPTERAASLATRQVMKMVMPLLSPAAGRICFALPEGSILSAGDLIARLELENPGRRHQGAIERILLS